MLPTHRLRIYRRRPTGRSAGLPSRRATTQTICRLPWVFSSHAPGSGIMVTWSACPRWSCSVIGRSRHQAAPSPRRRLVRASVPGPGERSRRAAGPDIRSRPKDWKSCGCLQSPLDGTLCARGSGGRERSSRMTLERGGLPPAPSHVCPRSGSRAPLLFGRRPRRRRMRGEHLGTPTPHLAAITVSTATPPLGPAPPHYPGWPAGRPSSPGTNRLRPCVLGGHHLD